MNEIDLRGYSVKFLDRSIWDSFILILRGLTTKEAGKALDYKCEWRGDPLSYVKKTERIPARRFPLFLKLLNERSKQNLSPLQMTKEKIEIYHTSSRVKYIPVNSEVFNAIVQEWCKVFNDDNKS